MRVRERHTHTHIHRRKVVGELVGEGDCGEGVYGGLGGVVNEGARGCGRSSVLEFLLG